MLKRRDSTSSSTKSRRDSITSLVSLPKPKRSISTTMKAFKSGFKSKSKLNINETDVDSVGPDADEEEDVFAEEEDNSDERGEVKQPWETMVKSSPGSRPKTSSLSNSLKAQDFQICITVIEARQLAGLNMDPVVCVQVGEIKKFTSVKESTNCPYYNEYFVFDFHMAPVMLFDKIISFTVWSGRTLVKKGTLVGTFKLDVGTVNNNHDHQFYHKWALLTDPDDTSGGPKGYLKCDISVITKGDAVKIPPKTEKDEDDIESNLLLPVGVTSERARAKFLVRIYRADGLPRMNSSVVSNLKHAFGAQSKDLVDPYVQVSFAGLTGRTAVKRNTYNPVWNEQIVFTEMFPPLCQRIKIQLKESDTTGDTVIGTHFLDISSMSNDGDKDPDTKECYTTSYLPTFGPAFIHVYGSTRDYSMIDENSPLNEGLGEGVAYRGRILISIKTEISDSIDTAPSEVEVEATQTINEAVYNKKDEFFLFGTLMEATMIDKRLADKAISFEISIGNAGNSLDGQATTHQPPAADEINGAADHDERPEDGEDVMRGSWLSTTPATKPLSHDRLYYFLPVWDDKPTVYIRTAMPDHRRRMYISNAIEKIANKLDENLHDVHTALEAELDTAEQKLKNTFELLQQSCQAFLTISKTPNTGLSMVGKTRLDKERFKQCQGEIESILGQARQWKLGVKKHTVREKYRGALGFLDRLRRVTEDPQHSIPDIFIWLLSGNKRMAYQRIPSRTLLYSMNEEECGPDCGTVQTLFLKLAGKKGTGCQGWLIQAKLNIYLWLGLLKHKKCYPSGLPPGFHLTNEILNAEKPGLPPPPNVHYSEKHYFQLRAHVYQARSLIGSDASGLSDPFARVIMGEYTKTTQVIDETLSPTWDELMVFEEILVYGRREDIKVNPPTIIIEVYDQDKVGKAEFLGRALGKPQVLLCEEGHGYVAPNLEWLQILRGTEEAGELLATFEMFELSDSDEDVDLPPLPGHRPALPTDTGPVMPIPPEIRPTLVKYRFEVLFWGLRDLKRVQFLTVDKPRVDVECAGHIIQSSVILNAKKSPNFTTIVKHMDIELPEQEMYCPPLTIRVVDCRSFGRFTLVGTHTSNSIHKFLYHPVTKAMREDQEKQRALSFANLSHLADDYQTRKSSALSGYLRQKPTPVTVAADSTPKKDVNYLEAPPHPSPIPGHAETLTPRSSATGLEMWPRSREHLITLDYGVFTNRSNEKRIVDMGPQEPGQKTVEEKEDDEESMDWWTKYFASIDIMIEIIPILEISGFGGEALMNFLGSVGDLSKIDDLSQTLTNLTERISQSVSDLSNLKEMSPLSKSTGSLASAPGKLMKSGMGQMKSGMGQMKSGMGHIGKMAGIKKGKKLDSKSHLLGSTDSLSTISEAKVKRADEESEFDEEETVTDKGKDKDKEKDKVKEKEKKEKKEKKTSTFKSMTNVAKSWGATMSPKMAAPKTVVREKSATALLKVYPNELENQQEFEGFSEWLQTFDLYRGKKGDEEFEEENRVVGKFKGNIKIYKLPLPSDLDDHTVMGLDPQGGFFQGLPSNEPIRVLVRVYIVKANDLHPMDINGKADPYLVLQLGSKRISDKDNYVSKQLNPIFGKCFEIEATFPQDSVLTVQLIDWDLLGSDDLIGETKIDLENRFYSRHRATSGIATKYDPCGYNQWRDPMKPSQILTKLCKEGKVEGPTFVGNKVKVGDRTFTINKEKDVESPTGTKIFEEHLALAVLHHWHEIPRVGAHLVPEHIETRALYSPEKPGIEQGKVEMWVDMFPMDMPLPGLQVDISPRKPTSHELRVIIWNTDEVVLEDDAFFSGDKMSDIYVKGWLKGPEDAQATDVHYRSLTGEGNFNWRFVFPFEYLVAEEKVVISRKESVFSWDETITKVPPRLDLQVWDADAFSKDDFLGAICLDLTRFPRGAKTAKQCSLDMLKTDGTVPMVNLFKQLRTKGWWPLYAKDENDELVLQGKVEAELNLLTKDEAEKSPAGLGREDPAALEKPTRPDSSFMWFLNPLKSIRYIIWHNHKWTIMKILFIICMTVFLALFFYALPGVTVQKVLGVK